jgi:transposase
MNDKKTNITKVMELMNEGKKAKEIAETTGISIANTYNYMSRVRKLQGDKTPKRKYKTRKKLTPVNKKVEAPTHLSQYEKSLEHKVVSLHQQVEQLSNQNTALKIDLLDQTAIINYLEKKLGV